MYCGCRARIGSSAADRVFGAPTDASSAADVELLELLVLKAGNNVSAPH